MTNSRDHLSVSTRLQNPAPVEAGEARGGGGLEGAIEGTEEESRLHEDSSVLPVLFLSLPPSDAVIFEEHRKLNANNSGFLYPIPNVRDEV